jgi:hypothetical protein
MHRKSTKLFQYGDNTPTNAQGELNWNQFHFGLAIEKRTPISRDQTPSEFALFY